MKQKKKPMTRRVIAAMAAVVLLGLFAITTNIFTGNPISAYSARKHMEAYVEGTYPQMRLDLAKTEYNFKNRGYILRASDPNSPDTHFLVTRYPDGSIDDSYADYVVGGFNTIHRLGEEMTEEIELLLTDLFGSELSGQVFADLFGTEKNLSNPPALDIPYSRDLGLNATIYLNLEIPGLSLNDVATRIQKAHILISNEGYSVGSYRVEALDSETNTGYTVWVDVALINDELLTAMEVALESNVDSEQISVYSLRKDR